MTINTHTVWVTAVCRFFGVLIVYFLFGFVFLRVRATSGYRFCLHVACMVQPCFLWCVSFLRFTLSLPSFSSALSFVLAVQFVQKKEGREAIPQVEFWTSLPGLVKVRAGIVATLVVDACGPQCHAVKLGTPPVRCCAITHNFVVSLLSLNVSSPAALLQEGGGFIVGKVRGKSSTSYESI